MATDTADTAERPGREPEEAPEPARPSRVRQALSDPGRVWQLFGIPIVLAIALGALWLWLSGLELSTREATRLNWAELELRARQHFRLGLLAAVWVVVIAVPLGMLLTRPWARALAPVALAIGNAGQAIPSIGLMTLGAVWIGIGGRTAVMATIAYCVLPVLRNTMVGIRQVDPAIIEAGRGMGMTRWAVLTRIELPLAVPVILAGVRTALILAIGTITLGAFIDAGTFGVWINSGIVGFSDPVLIAGAVMAAAVALLIDWLAGIAEIVLRPKGL